MGEWARPCTERDTIKIVLMIQTSARGRKSLKGDSELLIRTAQPMEQEVSGFS